MDQHFIDCLQFSSGWNVKLFVFLEKSLVLFANFLWLLTRVSFLQKLCILYLESALFKDSRELTNKRQCFLEFQKFPKRLPVAKS